MTPSQLSAWHLSKAEHYGDTIRTLGKRGQRVQSFDKAFGLHMRAALNIIRWAGGPSSHRLEASRLLAIFEGRQS